MDTCSFFCQTPGVSHPVDRPLDARKRPSQQRAKDRVELILHAAYELLQEGGFDALNTRAIAARCGIGPSSLYQYFPNKHAIVRALAEHFVSEMTRDLDAMGKGASTPAGVGVFEALRGYWDAYVRECRAEPGVLALMLALRSDPELRKFDQELNERVAAGLASLLAQATRLPRAERLRVARVLVTIGDAMLMRIVEASPREARLLTRELHLLQRAYLEARLSESPG